MANSPNQKLVFRFGLYEIDAGTGELRKDGKARPRLQGQPLEILLYLLERPNELVTREELRQRLWPADTFVDYDHSLNAAVNKLRDALGDSAENSRFIQTIPRRGYRFIAPIEAPRGDAESVPAPEQLQTDAPTGSSAVSHKRNFVLSDSEDLPSAPQSLVRLLFFLIQMMYLSFYIVALANLHFVEPLLSEIVSRPRWIFILVAVTALAGIPIRLYLLAAAAFGYHGLRGRFLSLFPLLFVLDELWALSPFLLQQWIGVGLALAATAALLYVPFSQRSLLLMKESQ